MTPPGPTPRVYGSHHSSKVGVLEAGGQGRLLDLAQSRPPRTTPRVALSGAREMRFVVDVRVELTRRTPEQAERALTASMIPNACGDDTVAPGHTRHLGQSRDRIRHEVDDELGEGRIERVVRERQLLGGCLLHVDSGVARSSGGDERLGGVDGGHGRRPEPSDQLSRQSARDRSRRRAPVGRRALRRGPQAAGKAEASTCP